VYGFEVRRMTYQPDTKQFPLIFTFPVSPIIMGWGAHLMTGMQLNAVGIKHALVTTTGLRGTGIIEEVESVAKAAGVATTIFDKIHSNPRVDDVEEGLKAYKDAGCDGILSIGGGSSHDVGKMIRLRLANPDRTLQSMAMQIAPPWLELLMGITPVAVPQVAVNTTAGTGAEVTGFAVVTDWEAHWKLAVAAIGIAPTYGIDDPALMRTMPSHLAAQTGLDCLIHSFGGVLSRLDAEMAVALGLRGAQLVWEALPEFVYNRWNDRACEKMAWAQYLGAMTYGTGGGVGAIHAIAHQLSAVKDLHHGLANAIMMVPVTRLNIPAAAAKMEYLLKHVCGIDTSNMTRFQAAEAWVNELEKFRNLVGITDIKLSNYGIKEADCKHIASNCVNDVCMEANVRDMPEDDVEAFVKSLL